MSKQFDQRCFRVRHLFGPSQLKFSRWCSAKDLEPPNSAFDLNVPSPEDCINGSNNEPQPSQSPQNDQEPSSFDQPCDPNFRVNELNIQMLSRSLYEQLFPQCQPRRNYRALEYAKKELIKHGLPGKLHRVPDVDLTLPKLYKNDLEKHFYQLGVQQSAPYRKLVDQLVQSVPPMPKTWEFVPGWTKYVPGEKSVLVDFPDEEAIVFDVEVCVKEGENPVLATAVSNSAWYSWVSADLCRETKKLRKNNFYDYTTQELIPLETGPKVKSTSGSALSKPKIVVGHHVSYDRVRVKEQYWLSRTGARFLDTMSLHTCIRGVTSTQKMMLKAGTAQNESWYNTTSLNNSLKEVYRFYTGDELPKEERDIFITGDLKDVRENFQSLVSYCARDVQATHKVLLHLWPLFLDRFPHPVTLAGMLELNTSYLPVNRNWRRFVQDAQATFDDLNTEAKFLLSKQADKICQLLHEDKYKEDLWMWDQKWKIKKFTLNKEKPLTKKREAEKAEAAKTELQAKELLELPTNYDSDEFDCGRIAQLEKCFASLLESKQRLPAVIPHLAGYPEWYRILCDPPKSDDWKPGPNQVSTSLKTIPKLLSLTWNFMPLHHIREHGWCYFAPFKTDIQLPAEEALFFPLHSFFDYFCNMRHKCVVFDELIDKPKLCSQLELDILRKWHSCNHTNLQYGLIKLPHKDGDNFNVGNPLSRDFINKFSDLEISSGYPNVKHIFRINRQMTYWKNNRDRIENQMVVWLRGFELPQNLRSSILGVILPQVIVCGTLTRRAVESTWMTASNADDEKVGSELRSMIQAPPGYSIVGADVDSQELWIAGLIGDAYSAKEHGCTAFGWMTLSGQKSDGTDMHSMTARTMGISRSDAKVINYARIYGAGISFTERLFKQFIPGVSDKDANTKVRLMFQTTKGRRWFKLKPHVLPDLETRVHMRSPAQRLCEMYSLDVSELFEPPKWAGGSESAMFNSLENIACGAEPRTPFLQARMSMAVEPTEPGDTHQLTTRINWVVQSSAVDFLHLMLVCMRWLLDPQTRFCLSFHDEVRYLVPDEQKYEAALALHVTNLLVRSFFVRRVGMQDLPQSVAFFSSVEVDKVLRKDAHSDCSSPSNPYGLSNGYNIPFGESLDIKETIQKANGKIGIFECAQNQKIVKQESQNRISDTNMQYNHPWIDAYWEPNLGIKTFKNCLALVDLEANTEYKLVCVNFTDSQAFLKIFKGSSLYAETILPDIPSAATVFYTDSLQPRIPAIAVASGSQVLIYRNVRPYFKFTLPLIENEDAEATSVEMDVWRQKSDTHQLVQLLEELGTEHGFANLSTPSQKLLTMSTDERENFLKMPGHLQIKKQVTITNMTKIPKCIDGEKVVECLMVTTESSHLFVLDPETFSIVEQRKITGVTTHLLAKGVYTVDYFVLFCTRYGSVHKLMRDNANIECLASLPTLPVDLALDFNRFLAINMDSTFESYTLKGKKEWSVFLDGQPVAIYVMPAHISESTYLIACNTKKRDLVEGVLYIYKGTELLRTLLVQEPIQAFIFGPYGFGEQGFIFNTQGGGLSMKLLKRTAQFGRGDNCAMLGHSLHHNIKLLIPKKSRIFVEQTLRERDQCKEIYTWFQKTWQGMKILTCESYLNALRNATVSDNNTFKLTAQVIGLGPKLKLLGQLQNLSDEEIDKGVSVSFLYDADVYTVENPYIQIPFVIPKFEYKFATFINCCLNVSSRITLILCSNEKVVLTALLNMPPAMVPEL